MDYAGLFPPAGLDMPAAVAEYASRAAGPARLHAGALRGERVAPLRAGPGGLAAPARAGNRAPPGGSRPSWPTTSRPSLREIARFNATEAPRAVRGQRWRAGPRGPGGRAAAARRGAPVPLHLRRGAPRSRSPALLTALASRGARAKARTGGLSAEAVPSPEPARALPRRMRRPPPSLQGHRRPAPSAALRAALHLRRRQPARDHAWLPERVRGRGPAARGPDRRPRAPSPFSSSGTPRPSPSRATSCAWASRS